MTKDVFIRISGIHIEAGEDKQEPIEVICPGTYYKKDGKHYILYEEIQPDDNSVTKNTVKVCKGHYEVIKRGASNTHLIFEEGKNHTTMYETPYGSLFMDTYTDSVIFEETGDEFLIQVEYELKVNGEKIADCIIQMNVEAKRNENVIFKEKTGYE